MDGDKQISLRGFSDRHAFTQRDRLIAVPGDQDPILGDEYPPRPQADVQREVRFLQVAAPGAGVFPSVARIKTDRELRQGNISCESLIACFYAKRR